MAPDSSSVHPQVKAYTEAGLVTIRIDVQQHGSLGTCSYHKRRLPSRRTSRAMAGMQTVTMPARRELMPVIQVTDEITTIVLPFERSPF